MILKKIHDGDHADPNPIFLSGQIYMKDLESVE